MRTDELVDRLDPIFRSEGVALKARQAIEEANNSLYGSHGFFLSANGGEPDKFHLARPIEELKARSNKLYRETQEAAAEIRRLSGLVDIARSALSAIGGHGMGSAEDRNRAMAALAEMGEG